MRSHLPTDVAATIDRVFGARGAAWLAGLDDVVAERCAEWELTVTGPGFGGGTHSYVAPVRRADGSDAVLKVPVVDEENVGEPTGLACYDGDGAVRLYAFDPGTGAMLLERARPGTELLTQPGFPSLDGRPEHRDRIELACRLYRRLRRPPAELPAGFPPLPAALDMVAGWTAALRRPAAGFAEVLGPRLRADALDWCARLAEPDGPLLVVNRDTHLGNIVAAEREPWLLIDPKSYLGEAAFDAGFLIMIQVQSAPEPAHAAAVVARTADWLGIDPERARGWAFLRAVEEIGWAIEDDEPGLLRLHRAVAQALSGGGRAAV
ncbi:aminoglycoside phosphotransferase family protein [Nocardia farcinica]|uniref:aminoglycoside phosphotransferase family protein n=1 Tax=Nocardia farcinica TaxID=37329 RepID=UPI001893BCDE|nr:aminoglycoside phosphotransferase family protein [Nocardia farcinica]MBF6382966.1 kinase [Nocardia farcinica]MBF6538243.1 kinase [Nocardia farcinica]